METFFVIVGIVLFILNVVIIAKFFQIASDVRAIRYKSDEGSVTDLIEKVKVLVAVGAKEEAKRIVIEHLQGSIDYYIQEDHVSDMKYLHEQLRKEYGYVAKLVGIDLGKERTQVPPTVEEAMQNRANTFSL